MIVSVDVGSQHLERYDVRVTEIPRRHGGGVRRTTSGFALATAR
jgi:hypothetical protein